MNPNYPKTQHSLVERLQKGNVYPTYQREYERLFELYKGLMVAAALRVGVRAADCEDVVQDTMTKLSLGSIRQYDRTRGSFHSWLYTFAHRRAIDRLRKEKETPTDIRGSDTTSIDPARIVDAQAKLALADAALTWLVRQKRLNSNTAAIYRALKFEQRERDEVARFFKVTPNVVYNIDLRVSPKHRAVYEALCIGMDPDAALDKEDIS